MCYERLKCNLSPVDQKSDEYEMINSYLHMTHASTHQGYSYDIIDAFIIDREEEVTIKIISESELQSGQVG